jgi:hypothetical protein
MICYEYDMNECMLLILIAVFYFEICNMKQDCGINVMMGFIVGENILVTLGIVID